MAEHRYGKEELLQLFCEDPDKPLRMPTISPITRSSAHTPLAFMPLSEDEQVDDFFQENFGPLKIPVRRTKTCREMVPPD